MSIPEVEKIWMNGKFVAWKDATVHVLTHALHYGTGIFEGIRCYETPRGPAVFRLQDHLDRMMRAARVVNMPLGFTTDELTDVILELVRLNELSACYIRPLAYRGYGSLGLNDSLVPVDVSIAAWPWATYLGEEALRSGIRVTISSWRRNDPNVIPPDCKLTGAYVTSCLATVEANAAGFEEAIMLSRNGSLAEGSGENIFVVSGGRLQTPPLTADILPGVTRSAVIQIAADLGVETVQQQLNRSDLYGATEAFCVGTAAEVVPIREVDGRQIGPPGMITKEIQDRFFKIVKGEDEKYFHWFTFVDA